MFVNTKKSQPTFFNVEFLEWRDTTKIWEMPIVEHYIIHDIMNTLKNIGT